MIEDFITHFRFAQPGWLLLFIPSLLLVTLAWWSHPFPSRTRP